MSIEIDTYDRPTGGRWNELVERAANGTVFHRYEFLRVLERHCGGELVPLMGYRGKEPIGLFPVFEIQKGPFSTVFSPPPEMGMSQLGPLVLSDSGSVYERGGDVRSFTEAIFGWLRRNLSPKYVHIQTHDRWDDVRPFKWNGCRMAPRYTYTVELGDDEDALLDRFSGDARRNVRRYSADVTIREEGTDAIERILTQVRERYEEQGKLFPIETAVGPDLYEQLSPERVRPYVCRVDGEFVGGIVTFDAGETIYRWQGGVKTDADIAVNDLLDWRIMQDGIERGRDRYDLMGANTQRICAYKAKFNPELRVFYRIEAGNLVMSVLSMFYRQVRPLREPGKVLSPTSGFSALKYLERA